MQLVAKKEGTISRSPVVEYAKKSISYLKKKGKGRTFPGMLTAMTLAACSPVINPPVAHDMPQQTISIPGNIANTKFLLFFPKESHLFQAFAVKKEPVQTLSYKLKAFDDSESMDSGILFSAVELNGIVGKKWYQMGLFSIPSDMKITNDVDKKGHILAMGYEVWDKGVSVAPCRQTSCEMGFVPTKIKPGDEVVLTLSITGKNVKMSIHDLTTGEKIDGELPADGTHFDGTTTNEYNYATGLLREIASFRKLKKLPTASYDDLTKSRDKETIHVADEFTITINDNSRGIMNGREVYGLTISELSIPELSMTTHKKITRIGEKGAFLTYKPIPQNYFTKVFSEDQDAK